ncbi:O-methyltransferase GliM [Trichophyton interdigitale]|uniref:O-methyltransferase GliM n=2 Tax=Trichophyton interdigitale TaxID=101480 RepID=A0A9P5CWT5_9EURO|nr:O-methyltransferase GliM [Trichophyton interdigitale]KAF3900467.1 O-methyltransferase GliM [Trichophyton interdigitale]KAG8211405.1 O-methyltransferase GliM [Trichophyton interdigitale]
MFSAAGLTWRRPAMTPGTTLIKEPVHSFIHNVSDRYLLSKATYCDRLILSFMMLQSLTTVEAALRTVLWEFDQPNNAALLASLRRVDQGGDIRVTSSANNIIDLANKVIQTLEPAHLALADHLFAYQNTQCLAGAVKLRIADHLSDGPLKLEQLATSSKARPDRLRQILRLLSNNGIFHYDSATDTVRNNEASEMLQQSHWTQWHRWASVCGHEFYEMARGLPQSLEEDAVRSPAQIHYDTDESMFGFLESNGTMIRLRECMGATAMAQTPGMVSAYPWGELAGTTLIDLGGGDGSLIAALLRAFPDIRGGVFDTPRVLPFLREAFHSPAGKYADVGTRISSENLIAGDFLTEVVPAEAYVMRWCLHDWNDEQARKILENIRKSIIKGPVSRLVVLESVLADGRCSRMSRIGDINVMVTAEHGQERTESDWRRLASSSGWEIARIAPLPGAWPSAIDLRPSVKDDIATK